MNALSSKEHRISFWSQSWDYVHYYIIFLCKKIISYFWQVPKYFLKEEKSNFLVIKRLLSSCLCFWPFGSYREMTTKWFCYAQHHGSTPCSRSCLNSHFRGNNIAAEILSRRGVPLLASQPSQCFLQRMVGSRKSKELLLPLANSFHIE